MSRATVLFCIAVLVFAHTLTFPFVHDEIVFIVQNPQIAHFGGLGQIFSGHSATADIVGANAYYRPMLDVLYRVEYSWFGLNPVGWHLFNVLLHGLNGVLVLWFLALLGLSAPVPWAVALFFLVHPIQSEAVACVAGVSNLLMAFFVLSALIFYLKEKWILSLLFFVVALLTKEQSLMVVPFIFLIDWYRSRHLARGISFAAVALGFMAVRQLITHSNLLAGILASPGELKLRLIAIGQVLCTDVRMLFLPHDLHYYRSTDILTASPWWWVLVILVGLSLVKASKPVRFGALWFVLALLPVLNIIPLINEYSLILTAEHFLYLPMIGVMMIVAVFVEKALKGRFNWVVIAVATGLALATMYQNTFWRSETALFEHTVAYEKNFGRGHFLLAKAYYFDKRYREANEHFVKAYEIMLGYRNKAVGDGPKRFYAGFMKEILFDWAHALERLGALEQAKQKYLAAIELAPGDYKLWNNLGILCMNMGDIHQASIYFQKARDLTPQPRILP